MKSINKFSSRKDALLSQAFKALDAHLEQLEKLLDDSDLRRLVFGDAGEDVEWPQVAEHLTKTTFGTRLSALYDYAVDGIADPEGGSSYIVTEAAEVLDFLNVVPGAAQDGATWKDLVYMGDGRVALDEGMSVQVEKLALLAGVDLRTVRNAMSSGTLESFKHEGVTYIENASARSWLMARRGFKPTVLVDGAEELSQISTPVAFANFFVERRQEVDRLRKDYNSDESSLSAFPGLDATTIAKVEAGTFDMPICVINSLADYYGLDRSELLSCVMRVFFPHELSALRRLLTASAE